MLHGGACGPEGWVWMSHGFGPRGRWGRGRPPWWAGADDDRPPRAERGEIRFLVLDAIRERPRHGYEVIQHIEQRAKQSYRPSPGVIYPTLQMLEELGHARIVEQDGRKAYEITDAGRADLEQNAAAVEDFYRRFDADPWDAYAGDISDLMMSVARLIKVFKHGARRGRMTPETVRAIRAALDEAMHRIEDALNGPRR
jgi:DNA-binding PadR family transcriptional regulator